MEEILVWRQSQVGWGGGGTRDLPLESMQRLRSFAEGWLRPGIVIYRKKYDVQTTEATRFERVLSA